MALRVGVWVAVTSAAFGYGHLLRLRAIDWADDMIQPGDTSAADMLEFWILPLYTTTCAAVIAGILLFRRKR